MLVGIYWQRKAFAVENSGQTEIYDKTSRKIRYKQCIAATDSCSKTVPSKLKNENDTDKTSNVDI